MALTAKKVYAILKRQISNMEAKLNSPVRYRGTVATADLLPLNPDIGDMYNIESKSVYGEAGMNVAWNGVVWDTMGAPIDMSLYLTKEEAETVIQRLVTEYFEKNPVKPGATTEQAQQIEQNKTDIASLKTETGSLKGDLNYLSEDYFKPLEIETVSGVKNKWDITNIADVNYHIELSVSAGEKYMISGSGINANHPMYVICSDSAVLLFSDDTTYNYLSDVEITIPAGATKLYVNGRYEYYPYIKKYNIEEKVFRDVKDLITQHPLKSRYDIPLQVESLLYHTEFPNLANDSGYSAIIDVSEGEMYSLTGSGTGQYASYIIYDKNMSILAYGDSTAIADCLVTIPTNGRKLRVQNNKGTLLKIYRIISKYAVFVGDSYTQGNSLGDEQNKRFSTTLSSMLGLEEINVGAGGCGYFKTDSCQTYFYQQIVNAINSMTQEQWSNTEYVFICGGRNDPNNYPNATQSEYDSAVSDICTIAHKYFGNAKIVFVPYLFGANYMPNNYFKHYLMLIRALQKNKCSVINYAYTWLTGRFNFILDDNVHPNVDGHDLIAHLIYNALNGGTHLNNQSIRLMGISDYMPEWTYIDIQLLGNDTLNIFGFFTVSGSVPANTAILQSSIGSEKSFLPYTGRSSFSLLMQNLSTGVSYSCYLKYDESDASDYKLQLYSNTNIPSGNYMISFNAPFGRL